MLVDYKVRCETDTMIDGLPCRVIRYGVTKAECNEGLYCPAWYDVGTHQSGGGRTTPIENETIRHFFNKRIMTDEEKNCDLRAQAQTILGDSDSGSVGAPDGEGSTDSPQELEDTAGGAGCSDRGTTSDFNWEEDVTS